MTTTFSINDVVTLKSGAVWRVSSVRTHVSPGTVRAPEPGDDPYRIVVGLDDPDNPGKHGTAFTAAVLATLVVTHTQADRASVIEQLAADLDTNAWFADSGAARIAAARLVGLGWHR